MAVPKKRKHSGEEKKLPEKRQKKTIEASKFAEEPVDAEAITRAKFTKPEKSITALIRLRETKTDSKVTRLIRENNNTTSRVILRHDRNTNTNPRVIKGKSKQSVTALIRFRETKVDPKVTRLISENTAWRIRDHDTKRKGRAVITRKPGDEVDKQNHGFKDLIAKAREKLQEKRQNDDRNTDIASQRIAARLALDQMVETDDDFDDHLKYHTELQNLGCDFIRDQVRCLKMFSLLSRSDYESNSALETKELPTAW
ncbi:hypothetical protein Bca4012_056296 [Brassica carinata]